MTWNDLKKQTNPQIRFSISSPQQTKKNRTPRGAWFSWFSFSWRLTSTIFQTLDVLWPWRIPSKKSHQIRNTPEVETQSMKGLGRRELISNLEILTFWLDPLPSFYVANEGFCWLESPILKMTKNPGGDYDWEGERPIEFQLSSLFWCLKIFWLPTWPVKDVSTCCFHPQRLFDASGCPFLSTKWW